MGFTKLDEGILQSSVMATDPVTFKVWIALLAAAKSDGTATVAAPFLAAVCRLPLETVRVALEELSRPDPDSRSLEDDGRRIKRVDGGWFLVNYAKYRQRAETEEAKAYERERKRRQRAMSGDVPECPGHAGTDAGRSASASPSSVVSAVAVVEGVQGEDRRPDHERVRGSNFREAMALETKILRAVDQISKRTGKPAWEVCRKVTSYKRPNGEMTAGVEDPARLGSILARQKALEDAEWWIAELDKGAPDGSR
jgi:hypothetical protein